MIVCATENCYSVLFQLKNLSVAEGLFCFLLISSFMPMDRGPDRFLKYRTTPVKAVRSTPLFVVTQITNDVTKLQNVRRGGGPRNFEKWFHPTSSAASPLKSDVQNQAQLDVWQYSYSASISYFREWPNLALEPAIKSHSVAHPGSKFGELGLPPEFLRLSGVRVRVTMVKWKKKVGSWGGGVQPLQYSRRIPCILIIN